MASPPIYLDNQATTPLAPEVFDAMTPWLRDHFGNPHSPHILGRKAAAVVEVAREKVLQLLPSGGHLVFCGSATEALNLGFGAVKKMRDGGRDTIIVLDTEHAAVRDTALAYKALGFRVILHPVGPDGLVKSETLETQIDERTALVAAMLVNNEIGVIQPVSAIADLAHEKGALMLCDVVQGYGRVKIPGNVDMLALSAHKIYGPKGIGALWVREGIDLPPLIYGGGQERGIRSGTLSPALCVGLGEAAQLCVDRKEVDSKHIEKLASRAKNLFNDWIINGSQTQRFAGNLNIRYPGLDVARLMSDVRDVAFSAGSACASGSGRPSHVLAALGLDIAEIKSSIRLSVGRYNDLQDIDKAFKLITKAKKAQGL